MNKSKKTKWNNLSVPLGNNDIAPERRAAYEAQALVENVKLATWCRKHLDSASKFNEQEVPGVAQGQNAE